MTDATVGSRRFEIGRVISQTFGVIGRNILPFGLLALLLGGLPKLLVTLVQLRLIGDAVQFSPIQIVATIVGGLALLVASFVLQAAIVHATLADLNGRRVVLADSLKMAIDNALPLIGLGLLTVLGLVTGMILLVVPGLFLMVLWSVAVPAKVAEQVGIFESFARSSALTRGRRWAIFGLFVIYGIAAWVLTTVIVAAFAPLALAKGLPGDSGAMDQFLHTLNLAQLVAAPTSATLTALVSTTGVAALYYELRASREGVGPEALASVFE